ncbi:conserved hypothetical protein [Theileria orientalis strain Shintoku]|uniref:Uncharacterized protein n=1 Tax=Theileria orientalis strain Shintoku TaxID=869250 RepID=J4DPM4_THEOR|nr:conserved hypothetical protein [Theileria orientalis strain Shintoku]BAM40959.1 conserved hypothetical protein [Theileria orientalis strain Shintoku]|eukprot:XP_009691260.1 conserved hypothetical protein [Theileria orientalis strain Shintoku]
MVSLYNERVISNMNSTFTNYLLKLLFEYKPIAFNFSDMCEGNVSFISFYTSNIATHFAPYMIPVFIRRGCINNINNVLINNESTVADRFYAYSALNKICSNIHAINYLKENNFTNEEQIDLDLSEMIIPFKKLLNTLVEPKKIITINKQNPEGLVEHKQYDESEIIFDQKIKAFENLLNSIKPEDRELTYDQISKIVKDSNKYKSIQSQERLSKALLLLLQNNNNVNKIIENELEHFSNVPIIKSSESTNTSVTELCPVLINSIPELLVPFQQKWLKEYADEIKSATILFQSSLMYALIRGLFDSLSPGQSRLTSLRNGIVHGIKCFRGLAIFELICIIQNKIIYSKVYFENEKKKDALIMSFLLSLSTFGSLAAIMSTQRYCKIIII